MMTEICVNDYINQFTEQLSKGGAFLTAGAQPNPMTIGWGSIGVYWGKSILTVPIRHSRFTHSLIEETGEFSVSVPLHDMKKELAFCGTRSGRDTDKCSELGLNPIPCQKTGTSVIGGAGLHLECKVLAKKDLEAADLPEEILGKWYPGGDMHTLYFAKIIAAYKD